MQPLSRGLSGRPLGRGRGARPGERLGEQQSGRPHAQGRRGGGSVWAGGRSWEDMQYRALTRSAGMRLPDVSHATPALATCCSSARVVPLQSRVLPHTPVPASTVAALTHDVAQRVWHTLVLAPGEAVDVTAPMGNSPRPELLFNSPLKVQYSRSGVRAAKAQQGQARICAACWDQHGSRGACCDDGGPRCSGCDSCVGRLFECPKCGTRFENRWLYEGGSARSSIGRNPLSFRICRFTPAMEQAAKAIDGVEGSQMEGAVGVRSAVVVTYLGDAYCVACALNLEHKSKVCGSVLHAHRDRAGGANTQAPTSNHVITVGASRTLSMEQRLLEVRSLPVVQTPELGTADEVMVANPVNPEGSSCQFELTHGSHFVLAPDDEELRPRAVGDGRVAKGCYMHGMSTPLTGGQVSCGVVFRAVEGIAEVDVQTDLVLITPERWRQLHTVALRKGGNHAASWSPAGAHTRAQAFSTAQGWWRRVASHFGASIRETLRGELAGWPGCSHLQLPETSTTGDWGSPSASTTREGGGQGDGVKPCQVSQQQRESRLR